MSSAIGDSFLKAANATRPSLSFRAGLSESPPYKGVLTGHLPLVPLTNPNERRCRACSPAQAPPTPAGRGPSGRQSSARSPAIAARNAPRRGTHSERGLPAWQCRGLLGGDGPTRESRQRPGRPSQRRLGGNSRPRRIVWHSPRGGTKLDQHTGSPGPVAVDAPLRKNHADPRVHCALAWRRPTVGIHQTQSPHVH